MALITVTEAKTPSYRGTLLRGLEHLLVAASPVLVTLLLVGVLFKATLLDFTPTDSDEVHYWHETLTFLHAGFNGGYYTALERPPLAGFTHFGPHGPAWPMLYGAIAYMTGWKLYTGVMVTMVAMVLALVLFVRLTHLERTGRLLLALMLVTSWSTLLYVPTNFQEPFHDTLAIMMAGLFVWMLQHPTRSYLGLSTLLIVILVGALLRPTWAFLLAPVLLAGLNVRSPLGILGVFGLSALAFPVLWTVWRYISAPWLGGLDAVIGVFRASFVDGLKVMWGAALVNLGPVLGRQGDYALSFGLVLQVTAVLVVTMVMLIILVLPRWRISSAVSSRIWTGPEIALHLGNLGSIFGMSLLFYGFGIEQGYRVISPHLLLSQMMLAGQRGRSWLLIAIVVSNLIILPVFLDRFESRRRVNFSYPQENLASLREMMADAGVRYEPGKDPWCNTVLSIQYPIDHLQMVPAGMGISWTPAPDQMLEHPKSKYLIMSKDVYEETRKHVNMNIQHLTGIVYKNLDANCPP